MERLGLSMLNLCNSIYSTGIIAHLKYIWQIFSTPMAVSPRCGFLCCTEAFYFHIIPPANSWCCFCSRKFLPMPNSWYVFSVLFQQFLSLFLFIFYFLFFCRSGIVIPLHHCSFCLGLHCLFRIFSVFPHEIQYLFLVLKNVIGNLTDIALSLETAFNDRAIFSLLILSIYTHRRFPHPLVPSPISFLNILKFLFQSTAS